MTTTRLNLTPEGSVLEVVSYRKQLVKELAAGVLANPNLQPGEYSKFARTMIEIADTIIKELEKE